jgi:hypothetical protein
MADPLPGDWFVTPTHADHIEALGGWLTRWGTNAPVNHAALHVGDGHLIEAAPSGVRRVKMRAGGYPDAFWSTGRFDLSPSERAAICSTAQAFVDARPPIGYGWADLIAIALAQHRAGGLVDRTRPLNRQPWWVRRIQSMNTLICSQLVDKAYEIGGVHLFDDGRIPGLVSPGDLWRLIGSPPIRRNP